MITQSQISQRFLSQKYIYEHRDKNLKGVENGVLFWLNADNVITDSNGYVSQMIDLTGNNNSPVQSVQNNKPLLVQNSVNGHPSINFNGSQWLKKQFSQPIPQPITIFAVWNLNTSAPQYIYDNYSTNNFGMFYSGGIGITAPTVMKYSKATPFNYILSSNVYNYTSSKMFENGVLKASGDVGANIMNGITLGINYAGNYGLNADLAEIIGVINCSDSFRQTNEQTLKEKYALL